MAAALYKLPGFVDWPAGSFTDSDSNFRLCVVGDKKAFGAFDSLVKHEGKRTKGRTVAIHHFRKINQAKDCHLVFLIGNFERKEYLELRERSVVGWLTVSALPQFARKGGIVGMKFPNRQLRFEINLEAAKLAGLNLSAQLLSLAEIVKTLEVSFPTD